MKKLNNEELVESLVFAVIEYEDNVCDELYKKEQDIQDELLRRLKERDELEKKVERLKKFIEIGCQDDSSQCCFLTELLYLRDFVDKLESQLAMKQKAVEAMEKMRLVYLAEEGGKGIMEVSHVSYMYGTGSACKGDKHVFIYAGGYSDDKIPEGFPCDCGVYKAHWVKCPTCGQDKLELIRNE